MASQHNPIVRTHTHPCTHARTYHSGFLDDPEHPEVREDVGLARRELGQLLTVFAAENSPGPADHEADAALGARVLRDGLATREGGVGLLVDEVSDARGEI